MSIIQKCQECDYRGDINNFDYKEDKCICPKCGSNETYELAQSFLKF